MLIDLCAQYIFQQPMKNLSEGQTPRPEPSALPALDGKQLEEAPSTAQALERASEGIDAVRRGEEPPGREPTREV